VEQRVIARTGTDKKSLSKGSGPCPGGRSHRQKLHVQLLEPMPHHADAEKRNERQREGESQEIENLVEDVGKVWWSRIKPKRVVDRLKNLSGKRGQPGLGGKKNR